MKRDKNLIFKLLTAIEQANTPEVNRSSIKIDGYDDEALHEHINLIIESGFVTDGKRSMFDDIPTDRAKTAERLFGTGGLRLSWSGHDYLDTQRGRQQSSD